METYVHHVPGRLRVRLPSVKNDPAAVQPLRIRLQGVPGVSSIETNAVTGSVLIHYDIARTSAPAILKTLGAVARVQPRHRIAQAVADYLVERAIGKAAIALIAAVL